MNRWQKIFFAFGVIAAASLLLFPPKIIMPGMVRHFFITSDYPVDWLRLFLWLVADFFVAGLGIAVNKQEHG